MARSVSNAGVPLAHGERDPVELRSAGLRVVDRRIKAFRRSWLD